MSNEKITTIHSIVGLIKKKDVLNKILLNKILLNPSYKMIK